MRPILIATLFLCAGVASAQTTLRQEAEAISSVEQASTNSQRLGAAWQQVKHYVEALGVNKAALQASEDTTLNAMAAKVGPQVQTDVLAAVTNLQGMAQIIADMGDLVGLSSLRLYNNGNPIAVTQDQ